MKTSVRAITILIAAVSLAAALIRFNWGRRRHDAPLASPTEPADTDKAGRRRGNSMRGFFLLAVGFAIVFVSSFHLLSNLPEEIDGQDQASPHVASPGYLATVIALPSGRTVQASPTPAATRDPAQTPTPTATLEAVETEPTAAPAGQEVVRVTVPRLAIDAPIVGLGVLPDGTMDAPATPTDVGWYTFSARPGEGSNVVMGGHVDYHNYGPAVFYQLRNALSGDEVHLLLEDGSTATYRVVNITLYEEATAPVDEIVGPTDGEMLTLITCGGSFDPQVGEYDKRVVLRAERVETAATGR